MANPSHPLWVASVSDPAIALTASGTPAEARARVQDYIDHGCTCPILYPLGPDVRLMIDTFADYKTTAGDSDLAAKFLHKAFPSAIIDEAASWYGVEIPDPTAAVEMPA